jgi:biotin operon repressor
VQASILLFLKDSSKNNPVKRKTLSLLLGIPDRKVRAGIAELQAQGHPIVSLNVGYFLGTREEVEAYKRREMHRAFSLLSKLKRMFPDFQEVARQLKLEI